MDERIRQVIASTFGLDPTTVDETASQQTLEAWDSLGHINLVLALEIEFGAQFSIGEIPLLADFTAIRDALTRRSLAA
jgi:acyl carrier protein